MNILEMMLSGQDSAQIRQLARQFGIGEEQAQSVVKQVVPALSQGVKRNTASEDGLQSLLRALQKGDHNRYMEQPESLADQRTKEDGNAILGHIFGSKDVSRAVAERATGGTGLDAGLLKQMLPIVASMMMGSLSKQASNSGLTGQQNASGGVMDMLSGFLDADKDGSIADDLLGMAGKFFR